MIRIPFTLIQHLTFFCPLIYIFVANRILGFTLFSNKFIIITLYYFGAQIVLHLASGNQN
jgi:hypothetical protein